ncbi:MAG TPA: DUF4037 domain-containing protein [Thermomicrobiales bacterium]|nr:DUF4037 domain-containing protein [Thermomicrobiales bacterium]
MTTLRPFIPGLELSRILFKDAVEPLLCEHFPELRYAAGLIGSGSDVLGFDTERSTDHDWGPRVFILIDDTIPHSTHEAISGVMALHLPATIAGYSTRYAESPLEAGTKVLPEIATGGPMGHGVTTGTLGQFLMSTCGIRSTQRIHAATWLTMSEQHLLEVTRGGVWRDDIGELTRARADLAWYPDDVWRYRLAAGWKRIAQHEAFIGRTGEVGDNLGSQLITLALVRDIMQLAFLLERQYAPYEKWFGAAFARLSLGPTLAPFLDRARFAQGWREREATIVDAVQTLAHAQNDLGIAGPVDPTPRPFFNRPFQVLFAERFSDALVDAISDPDVLAMPRHLGGIDQYIDSTDGRERIDLHLAIRAWLAGRAS